MPRKYLERSAEYPYHITSRSNNREWFYVPKHDCWKIFTKIFPKISNTYNARIISFVLLDNHFHMLILTPDANLGCIMNYLIREVSRSIGSISGRINRVFGGRYKWSLIKTEEYFAHAYRYIYQNPLRANICSKVQDYPYSTLKFEKNIRQPDYPLAHHITDNSPYIPNDLPNRLEWLNQSYNDDQITVIKKALRRREFAWSKMRQLQPINQSLKF